MTKCENGPVNHRDRRLTSRQVGLKQNHSPSKCWELLGANVVPPPRRVDAEPPHQKAPQTPSPSSSASGRVPLEGQYVHCHGLDFMTGTQFSSSFLMIGTTEALKEQFPEFTEAHFPMEESSIGTQPRRGL